MSSVSLALWLQQLTTNNNFTNSWQLYIYIYIGKAWRSKAITNWCIFVVHHSTPWGSYSWNRDGGIRKQLGVLLVVEAFHKHKKFLTRERDGKSIFDHFLGAKGSPVDKQPLRFSSWYLGWCPSLVSEVGWKFGIVGWGPKTCPVRAIVVSSMANARLEAPPATTFHSLNHYVCGPNVHSQSGSWDQRIREHFQREV